MSTIDERTAYLNNPYFNKRIYGDFTPFYITITICAVVGLALILLNVILGCCSRHKRYWTDRNTGNLWLASIWTRGPRNQPPLDLTELGPLSKHKSGKVFNEYIETFPVQQTSYHHQERPQRPQKREEYVELQKRESDI